MVGPYTKAECPGALPIPILSMQQSYLFVCALTNAKNARATTELWLPHGARGIAQSIPQLSKMVVAVKRAESVAGAKQLEIEIAILKHIRHNRDGNHVGTKRIFDMVGYDPVSEWWMATGFCSGGTLKACINNRKANGWTSANPILMWHVTKQVMEALMFLHGHAGVRDCDLRKCEGSGAGGKRTPAVITHCDLHGENICFDLASSREFAPLPNIRVIDFGLARVTEPGDCLTSEPSILRRYEIDTAIQKVIPTAHNEDIILDLRFLRQLVHWLAHPTGHDLRGLVPENQLKTLPPGTCVCCWNQVANSDPSFTAKDAEFATLMAVLPMSRKMPVPGADLYSQIIELAHRRRELAFTDTQNGGGVPHIPATIDMDQEMRNLSMRCTIRAELNEQLPALSTKWKDRWEEKWRIIVSKEAMEAAEGERAEGFPSSWGSDPSSTQSGAAGEVRVDHDGDVIMKN